MKKITQKLTKSIWKSSLVALTFLFGLSINAQDLVLQGIIDFDVPSAGSDGKAIHVLVVNDIDNLSLYGIGVANNGGGTDGQEYTFPAVSVLAGDNIMVARSPEAMASFLGATEANIMLASSDIGQNGDDAIELFYNGEVIETFGDVDTDGTGESWEYVDSFAYKVDGAWTYAAINCTDDAETSATSACPYPYTGVYTVGTEIQTETFDVTFSVNTANITVGELGMYVGGGVLGGANAYAMSDDDGDGTWTVTIALNEGTTGNYIFLNSPAADNDWGAKENLAGQACSDPNNYDDRILDPVTADTTLLHCFGSCETDGSCPSEFFDVTFSVNTANITVGENGMYAGGGVLGDATAYAMSDDDGDGTWTVTISLVSGTSGNYTFLNSPNDGGDWGAKEDLAGQECADANNYNDRILAEVTADTTLLHCFGSCETDGTCGGPAEPITMPVDHENENVVYAWNDFGGAATTIIANPDASGANTSATVAQSVKNEGSETWAGTFIVLDELLDFSTLTTLAVDVWTPDGGELVNLKVEKEGESYAIEQNQPTTVASGWETLYYDLSAEDLSAEYNKLVLFFDFNVVGDGTAYYFDNIRLSEGNTGDSCVYTIRLEDTYGDTWNGNTMDVMVNGEVVLDGITVGADDNGGDFAVYDINVNEGDVITTTSYNEGDYVTETQYFIYNIEGLQVGSSFDGAAMNPESITTTCIIPEPGIAITGIEDGSTIGFGATTATFGVAIEGFSVSEAGAGGDGHWHYSIDGGATVMVYDLNDVTIDVTAGATHTILAWLVDDNHQPLDPAAESTVTFTVPSSEAGCGDEFYYDYGNNEGADALFTATNPDGPIVLTITGQIEGNYDSITVQDGAGNVLVDAYTPADTATDIIELDPITSDDGTVVVFVTSDGSVDGGAFADPIYFSISCPNPNTELIALLESGSWRSEAETQGHIGVGPNGSFAAEWWNANPWDKWETGLYDDRWSFAGGVVTVDTGDDGAIFGKKPELDAAFPDNTPYDADNSDNEYLYYAQDDYTDTFTVSDLGAEVETITFATNGNIGFYTSIAGQEFQVLERTETTMYVRNVGSETNAWYNKLSTADALSTVDAMMLDMRIYPNPSNGSYVTIQTPVSGVKYVEVFDITGKRLINTSLSADTLDVSSMSTGMYLVKVTVEGQSKVSKLIIR
ncbi:T9SS type A sorting domain-containing protein [Flavobacteriaceae bacterium]|nr:T9SS type A sorting domain-containing protein [Flavobacteriaceae bacterium]